MKKISTLILVALLTSTAAMAQTILAAWTFDNLPGNSSADGPTPKVIASNTDIGEQQGTAFIYADGTHGSSDFVSVSTASATELNSIAGHADNDPRTPAVAGNALVIKNPTTNGKSIVLVLSTTDYQNPVLSFCMRRASLAHSVHVWEYSTDGNTFYPVSIAYTIPTNTDPEVKTVDLSAYDNLDHAATIYLRLTMSGSSSALGSTRFDNIVINAETTGPDVTAPKLSSYSILDDSHIKLIFNEPLNQTIAQTAGNYTFSGSVSVSSATLANDKEVTLILNPAMTEDNSYSLTISNIEDLTGNVMNDSTLNFTFGLGAEYQMATIAELRAQWTDPLNPNPPTSSGIVGTTLYKLTGEVIVTVVNNTYRNQIFIQDATGAIVIDNISDGSAVLSPDINQGNKIKNIYGTLTDYYGHLQFVAKEPTYDFIAASQEVVPLVITLSQLDDIDYMNSIQSQLIKIQDVTFTDSSNFANDGYYRLTQDGVGVDSAVWIHIWDVPTLTGQPVPTTAKDITGVNKITRNTYCIIPRDGSDITDPADIGIANISSFNAAIYPNPVQDILTVKADNQLKTIEIFNMFGQHIRTQQANGNRTIINVSNLSSGVYMLKLTGDHGFTTSKFVKR
jgi:hypothetical protein